ncbi:MAG TPA: WecB/TagA/CpsF family glycosyltransferase [Bacillota bacterium]|nr:WecB/TagA/CpsF family glycosyltransferase [Bacillota bacterium]
MDVRSKQELKELVTGWLLAPVCSRQIVTLNALILMRAWQDARMRRIVQRADLVTVDGVGVELALRKKGYEKIQRFTGLELTLEMLSRLRGKNCSVYLYGGAPRVVALLKQMIPRRFPDVSLCAVRDGYSQQMPPIQVMGEIVAKQPGLLLVALGSPKQEIFLDEVLPRLKGTVGVGVGGAFEVLAGIKREAPQFVRDLGVEWLFRMLQDPLRVKKIPDLVKFGYYMLKLRQD